MSFHAAYCYSCGVHNLDAHATCGRCGRLNVLYPTPAAPVQLVVKNWTPQIKFILGYSKNKVVEKGWEKLGVFGRITNQLKNKEWGKVDFLIDPFTDSGVGLSEFKILWGAVNGAEPTIEITLKWIDLTIFSKLSKFVLHGIQMEWTENEKSDGRFMDRLLTIRRFADSFKIATLLEEANKLIDFVTLSNTLRQTPTTNLLNVMSACTVFQNGVMYGLKELKEPAFSYILKNAKQIFKEGKKEPAFFYILKNAQQIFKEGKNYFGLNSNSFCEILKSDDLEIESELDVFKAILLWGENQCKVQNQPVNKENTKNMVLSLLPEVRFPLMTKQELAKHIYTSGILSQEQICGILAAQKLNKYLTPGEQHSAGSFNSKPRNTKQKIAEPENENDNGKGEFLELNIKPN